jgi:hypothetical protein
MCSRAVPDLYFIGQRCKTVRVLMNRRREGRQKKTLCPAPAAEKGAANITHRAYITKGVTGGTALLGAGGKKQQRRTAAACTYLHAPVRTPPPPSHHDDHHNSCRVKQERGDTSLSAPASSPELLGTPARTSTLAHSMIPQKSRSRRVNQQTNKYTFLFRSERKDVDACSISSCSHRVHMGEDRHCEEAVLGWGR